MAHVVFVMAVGFTLLWQVSPVLAELPHFDDPRWQPVADGVYLQEVGRHIERDRPITAVAVHGDALYAGDENGVWPT